MCKSVLALGPFIGDFEQEIKTFRPYAQYIIQTRNNEFDEIYISSHITRKFLYHFMNQEKFIPVLENITRNELTQIGYINSEISKQEYIQLTRLYKTIISKQENINLSNITNISLPYIKHINKIISYDEKLYSKIKYNDVDLSISELDMIVFIPDDTETSKDMFYTLKSIFDNVVVIGDMKCGLPEENIILKNNTYFHDSHNILCNYIMKSKFVITPISHWAFLCNLQNIPLLYYGDDFSLYKEKGIFDFNNNVITSISNIPNSDLIKYFNTKVENFKNVSNI
jgi:hypothetical protein